MSVHLSDGPTFAPAMLVAADYLALCEQVAQRIADLVREKPDAVLGLATGSTPTGVYVSLIRRHREDGLDFSQVTCFNLDEYFPMSPQSPRSYHAFMRAHLFDHIRCRRWSVPDGRERRVEEIEADCARYEQAIRDAGGIDLQLLGVGRSGHIGFNEPGSPRASRTRLVGLHPLTRQDAAAEFGGLTLVPTQAITMGIGTVLDARELVLMASSASKADIVQEAMTGAVTERLPASLVRLHPRVRLCLDRPAAQML